MLKPPGEFEFMARPCYGCDTTWESSSTPLDYFVFAPTHVGVVDTMLDTWLRFEANRRLNRSRPQ